MREDPELFSDPSEGRGGQLKEDKSRQLKGGPTQLFNRVTQFGADKSRQKSGGGTQVRESTARQMAPTDMRQMNGRTTQLSGRTTQLSGRTTQLGGNLTQFGLRAKAMAPGALLGHYLMSGNHGNNVRNPVNEVEAQNDEEDQNYGDEE